MYHYYLRSLWDRAHRNYSLFKGVFLYPKENLVNKKVEFDKLMVSLVGLKPLATQSDAQKPLWNVQCDNASTCRPRDGF